MGRRYVITFSKVSVSAVQDLISFTGSNNTLTRVLRAWCMCTDLTVASSTDQLAFDAYHTTMASIGSGGSTPTPQKQDIGDAAAVGTYHANDTSQMTNAGSQQFAGNWGCNIKQGLDIVFSTPVEVAADEGFAFRLTQAPGAAIHLSGGILVEQIGGI